MPPMRNLHDSRNQPLTTGEPTNGHGFEPVKECPRCHNAKPLAEFARNRSKPDGLQVFCRQCNREMHRIGTADKRAAAPAPAAEACANVFELFSLAIELAPAERRRLVRLLAAWDQEDTP